MDFNYAMGAVLTIALGFSTAAAEAKGDRVDCRRYFIVNYSKYVYSPLEGVICDTYGTAYTDGTAYCADGTGISMSRTEFFLGPDAVTAFVKMTEDGDFDETDFVMSNGVHCKTKINACFTQKNGTEIHEAITQRIWG
jgi:hypothetical protein